MTSWIKERLIYWPTRPCTYHVIKNIYGCRDKKKVWQEKRSQRYEFLISQKLPTIKEVHTHKQSNIWNPHVTFKNNTIFFLYIFLKLCLNSNLLIHIKFIMSDKMFFNQTENFELKRAQLVLKLPRYYLHDRLPAKITNLNIRRYDCLFKDYRSWVAYWFASVKVSINYHRCQNAQQLLPISKRLMEKPND